MKRDEALRKLREGQRLRGEGDRLIDEAAADLVRLEEVRDGKRVARTRPQPSTLTPEQKAALERRLRRLGIAS